MGKAFLVHLSLYQTFTLYITKWQLILGFLFYLWHWIVKHIHDGDHSEDRGYAQRDTRRWRTAWKKEADPGDNDDQCAWAVHVD